MSTSKQIIDIVYSTLADSNLSRVLPVLDEQIVIYSPETGSFGGEHRGRSGFLTMMSTIFKRWENLRVASIAYFLPENNPAEDAIVAVGTFEGKLHTSNELIVLPFIHYWHLKNEKVVEVRAFYWDTAALLAHLEPKKEDPDRSANGHSTSENGTAPE